MGGTAVFWYGIKGASKLLRERSGRMALTVSLGVLVLMIAGSVVLTGSARGTAQKRVVAQGRIITAGTVAVSRADFAWALEIRRVNYPYDIQDSPDAYNAMVFDLLSDLSDEAVLLAAAAARGIDPCDRAVDAAIADVKRGYPQGCFDRMLLERAIPYPAWKKRFKRDMVIQAFIMHDLVASQKIHPGDMIAFYDRLTKGRHTPGNHQSVNMDEESLLHRLRTEKAQDAFGDWFQGLQARYPVSVDKQALATFLIIPAGEQSKAVDDPDPAQNEK